MNNLRSIFIFIVFFLIASVLLVYNLEFKEKEKNIPYQIINYNDKIVEELAGEVNWIINWTASDERLNIVKEKIREFEFFNQDLTIHLAAKDDFLDDNKNLTMPQYIAECIKTNNYDWDIICVDDIIYLSVANILNDQFWGEKYLVDFEKVPGYRNSHQSFIFEDNYYSSITGNVFIGPYINGEVYAIWYNSALTRKIGIKIKDFGMTDKDLLEYMQAIVDYNKKHNVSILPLFKKRNDFSNYQLFQNLYLSALNQNINTENNSAEKMNALKLAFKAFENISKYNSLIQSNKKDIEGDIIKMTKNDEFVFIVGGLSLQTVFKYADSLNQLKMIPAELPVFKECKFYTGVHGPAWAVFKNARNQENAIQLLMYWCEPQIAGEWTKKTKIINALKNTANNKGIDRDIYDEFILKISQKYNDRFRNYQNASYIFGEENKNMSPILKQNLKELLLGNYTSEEAYRNIENNLIIE